MKLTYWDFSSPFFLSRVCTSTVVLKVSFIFSLFSLRPTSSSLVDFGLYSFRFACEWTSEARREKNYVLFYYHIEKSLNLLSSSHCVMYFIFGLWLALFSSFHIKIYRPVNVNRLTRPSSGNDCIWFSYWFYSKTLFFSQQKKKTK